MLMVLDLQLYTEVIGRLAGTRNNRYIAVTCMCSYKTFPPH